MEHIEFKVCIHCFTYNHAPFIADALNGFTKQQTTFPFVCVVIDDASTDEEQEVIRKYLEEYFELEDKTVVRNEETDDYTLTFAQHKTNKNCYFAVFNLKYNHYQKKKPKQPYLSEWEQRAEYIAYCEGDDYWSLSSKLQKQVDFLDKHPDYIMCSHDYIKYFENEKTFAESSFYHNYFNKTSSDLVHIDYSLDNYFKRWFTQPLTCVFRNGKYLSEMPRKKYKFFRDDIFFYYVLKQGKGALLKELMGVYRINDSGVWSTKDQAFKYNATIINAYNIYSVEKDKRALRRILNSEISLFLLRIREKDFRNCLNGISDSYRKLPFSYFATYLSKITLSLIKGCIRRLCRI